MLKIRFFRTGRKNHPFYRIVVTDSRHAPQGGRFLERVGFFNPLTKEQKLDEERIKYWLGVGAQPSPRVHNLLIDAKIIQGDKIDVLKKKVAAGSQAEATAQPTEKPAEEKKPELQEADKASEVKSESEDKSAEEKKPTEETSEPEKEEKEES